MKYAELLKTPGFKFPSVSKIVSQIQDTAGLERWRQKVGEAEAERISTASRLRGETYEKMVWYFLTGKQDAIPNELKYEPQYEAAYALFEKTRYDQLWTQFKTLYSYQKSHTHVYNHDVGYGYTFRTDFEVELYGQPIIIDTKTKSAPVAEKYQREMKLQLASYLNARYSEDFPCKKGLLFIANERDSWAQKIWVQDTELVNLISDFNDLLHMYYENNF